MYEQLRKEQRSLGNTRSEQLRRTTSQRSNTREVRRSARSRSFARRFRGALWCRKVLSPSCSTTSRAISPRWTIFPAPLAAAREAIGIFAASEPDHAHVAIAIEHLALVLALRGDLARAATLEGYADAAFERLGFPREFTEATTHDRLTALLHEGLAPDELARLSAEGAALTPEAAIALALEEPKGA